MSDVKPVSTGDQIAGLRAAARAVRMNGSYVALKDRKVDVSFPLECVLAAAAQQIESNGSALGLPVSYALEIAEIVLGKDLGSNK